MSETDTQLDFDLQLLLRSASEQAALLQEGKLSSTELTGQVLAAIRHFNPYLNCYLAIDAEAAMAAARASDQRRRQGASLSILDGLTVAVKDNIDVAGMVTTAGLGIPRHSRPARRDAFTVSRLRSAGAVIVGKLNMHEAALGATNDNPHHGRCINPHKPGYTPGGSSGGCGCAVAAGLCAFALGTDTMGSVRIPASYCGVSGIKPTRGRVSIGGTRLLSRRLDHVGPLARDPQDLNLILPVITAYDPACAQSSAMPSVADLPDIGGLTFGYADLSAGMEVCPEVQAAYGNMLRLAERAGAECRTQDLHSVDCGSVRRAGLMLCEVDLYVDQQFAIMEHPEYFSPALRKLIEFGIGRDAVDLMSADRRLDAAVTKMAGWLSDCDFLLLPTTPQSAFDFSAPVPAGQADLTNMANAGGFPAVSVPMGLNRGGLPLGLQIIGPHGSDMQLIALASWFAMEVGRPLPALAEFYPA